MINSKTKEVIAAPVTAYHPDGTVDVDTIPSYAAFLHSNELGFFDFCSKQPPTLVCEYL